MNSGELLMYLHVAVEEISCGGGRISIFLVLLAFVSLLLDLQVLDFAASV